MDFISKFNSLDKNLMGLIICSGVLLSVLSAGFAQFYSWIQTRKFLNIFYEEISPEKIGSSRPDEILMEYRIFQIKRETVTRYMESLLRSNETKEELENLIDDIRNSDLFVMAVCAPICVVCFLFLLFIR